MRWRRLSSPGSGLSSAGSGTGWPSTADAGDRYRGLYRRTDMEGLADRHVRCRNKAVLGHQHCDVIAYRVDLLEAKGAQRDQRAHPFVARENQHLDRIERDAEYLQEVLQVAVQDLADLVDLFVDALERGHLHDLIDRLLDHRCGVFVDLLGGDRVLDDRHVGHQRHRVVLGRDVEVVIHLVAHLRHFRGQGQPAGFHDHLGAVDVQRFILPRALTAKEGLSERTEDWPVRRRDRILPGIVDIEDRAARLQYAEMVAFDGEQRVVDDRVVRVVPDQNTWPHDLLTVISKRRNDTADTLHDNSPLCCLLQ